MDIHLLKDFINVTVLLNNNKQNMMVFKFLSFLSVFFSSCDTTQALCKLRDWIIHL